MKNNALHNTFETVFKGLFSKQEQDAARNRIDELGQKLNWEEIPVLEILKKLGLLMLTHPVYGLRKHATYTFWQPEISKVVTLCEKEATIGAEWFDVYKCDTKVPVVKNISHGVFCYINRKPVTADRHFSNAVADLLDRIGQNAVKNTKGDKATAAALAKDEVCLFIYAYLINELESLILKKRSSFNAARNIFPPIILN